LGLIMLSGSATALLGLILITGVSAFGVILRRGGGAGGAAIVGLLAAGLAVVTIATLAPDLVFKALGRDATFTGRVDIPDQVLAIINRRPWLGYGNGAFWEQDVFGGGMVREALQWEVFSAHQGWLELALDLGWVGVAAFAVSLALVSLRALAAFASQALVFGRRRF
jgi:O-antigen ligase